jgi:hypothetical protein
MVRKRRKPDDQPEIHDTVRAHYDDEYADHDSGRGFDVGRCHELAEHDARDARPDDHSEIHDTARHYDDEYANHDDIVWNFGIARFSDLDEHDTLLAEYADHREYDTTELDDRAEDQHEDYGPADDHHVTNQHDDIIAHQPRPPRLLRPWC